MLHWCLVPLVYTHLFPPVPRVRTLYQRPSESATCFIRSAHYLRLPLVGFSLVPWYLLPMDQPICFLDVTLRKQELSSQSFLLDSRKLFPMISSAYWSYWATLHLAVQMEVQKLLVLSWSKECFLTFSLHGCEAPCKWLLLEQSKSNPRWYAVSTPRCNRGWHKPYLSLNHLRNPHNLCLNRHTFQKHQHFRTSN